MCLWLFFLQTLEQVSSQTKASYIEAEAEYNICKNRFRDKLPSECTVQPIQCSQGRAARAVCVIPLSVDTPCLPVYAGPLCACVWGMCVHVWGIYVHVWGICPLTTASSVGLVWELLVLAPALHLLQWETMLTFTMGPFCLPHATAHSLPLAYNNTDFSEMFASYCRVCTIPFPVPCDNTDMHTVHVLLFVPVAVYASVAGSVRLCREGSMEYVKLHLLILALPATLPPPPPKKHFQLN